MTRYVYHADDGEVRVYPLDNLDVLDVPDELEDDFNEYVDDESPTLAEAQDWLRDHLEYAAQAGMPGQVRGLIPPYDAEPLARLDAASGALGSLLED